MLRYAGRHARTIAAGVVAATLLGACGGRSEPDGASEAPLPTPSAAMAHLPGVDGLRDVWGDPDVDDLVGELAGDRQELADHVLAAWNQPSPPTTITAQPAGLRGRRGRSAPAPASSTSRAGARWSVSTAAVPAEPGVDEPVVERETSTRTVEGRNGTTAQAVTETELRVEQRVLSFASEQTVSVTGAPAAGTLGRTFDGRVGACPTADGDVTGQVHATDTVTAPGERAHVELRADLVAVVGPDRTPVSFSLENVVYRLEVHADGQDRRSADGSGRVGEVAVAELHAVGHADMRFSSEDGDLRDTLADLFRGTLRDATLHTRVLLASVRNASADGLCVRLRVDRHGATTLGRGETAEIDVEVIDAVTGEVLDLPAEAVSPGDRVEPRELPVTPGTFVLTAATDEEHHVVYVTTDTVLGADDVEVVYADGGRWRVDAMVGPFRVEGVKCGGPAGRWELALTASFEGAHFRGQVAAELGADGTGPYTLTGQTVGGGITVEQAGTGTASFHEATDGAAYLEVTGQSWAGWANGQSTGGQAEGTAQLPLEPADPADCARISDSGH